MWTQPGEIGCLSSTSVTARLKLRRSSAAKPSSSTPRCCTTAMGRGYDRGSGASTRLRASSPPAEAPMTISSNISRRLAVELFDAVQLLVTVAVRRVEQRLLAPEAEHAEA